MGKEKFHSNLSRLRRIHVSLVKFLLRILSEVPALLHMRLNPIHQLSLRLSIDDGVDDNVFACFVVVGITECTLVDFVGFVVSIGDVGEISLHSIVRPASLVTVLPALPPKTRWLYK